MYVADRVVVLRAGKLIDIVDKKDTSIEQLSYMMIGRQVANLEIVEHDSDKTLLKVENLTLGSELGKKILDDVNLYVNAGEIVGIAGVSGNGQTELIRCISGLERNYQGKLLSMIMMFPTLMLPQSEKPAYRISRKTDICGAVLEKHQSLITF